MVVLKKAVLKLVGLGLNICYRLSPDLGVYKTTQFFSRPKKRIIPFEKEKFLQTADTEEIYLEGRVLRVYYWGAGEQSILLAHGWESNVSRWEDLIRYLQAQNYRIIALDAPGHGHSRGKFYDQTVYGKAIRSLIEKAGVHFVIGHSLGGFTLLLEQYRAPFKGVKKMVLMGTPVSFAKYHQNFRDNFGLNKKLNRDFETYFSKKYAYDLAHFSFLQVEDCFPIPLLFIQDKTDKVVNYRSTVQLTRKWKHAKLLLTDGFGHGLRDESVYTGILDFLTHKE